MFTLPPKNSSALIPLAMILCAVICIPQAFAKKRRAPGGGQRAVVVEERLAALRDAPSLSAHLLQRMGRGRMVSILGAKRAPDGLTFYRVAVTRRTRGWLQSEAVVSPSRAGDDGRLLRLIRSSEDFDRIARARIFLDLFPRSSHRVAVLLLYGDAAEEAADKLSRDATRRLEAHGTDGSGAPAFSYFLNYNGLDRYNRNGITFVFDRAASNFIITARAGARSFNATRTARKPRRPASG